MEEEPAAPGEERFFCPFPGCKRSFAELWRLKVRTPAGMAARERLGGERENIEPERGLWLSLSSDVVPPPRRAARARAQLNRTLSRLPAESEAPWRDLSAEHRAEARRARARARGRDFARVAGGHAAAGAGCCRAGTAMRRRWSGGSGEKRALKTAQPRDPPSPPPPPTPPKQKNAKKTGPLPRAA
jgi:hypothetical protein